MGQDSTFGVNPEWIRIDVRTAEEFATCCGVNLAASAFGGAGFFSKQLFKPRSFEAEAASVGWFTFVRRFTLVGEQRVGAGR
jgi:hypothetical protein